MSDKYVPQEPHAVSEKGKAFLGSLPPKERELHSLATKMLGSSYFVEKTHAFVKWSAKVTPGK
jgi:hypothetical protein